MAESILVLDTETTGLSSDDEILQLSVINDSGEVLFNRLYRPLRHDSWEYAQKVNHISPEMVSNCSPITADETEIISLLQSADCILGYNIDFDIRMLRNNLSGLDCVTFASLDVYRMYKDLELSARVPELSKHNLESVADALGFVLSEGEMLHNSLVDVEATLFVYKRLLELQ